MNHELLPVPSRDPVSGGPLIITELTSEETGITIRGRFGLPRFASLDHEHLQFLEAFLRCRGVISHVEKELGLSYPTVRGRLDALLSALDLRPAPMDARAQADAARAVIIDLLESGQFSPAEAKQRLEELR